MQGSQHRNHLREPNSARRTPGSGAIRGRGWGADPAFPSNREPGSATATRRSGGSIQATCWSASSDAPATEPTNVTPEKLCPYPIYGDVPTLRSKIRSKTRTLDMLLNRDRSILSNTLVAQYSRR